MSLCGAECESVVHVLWEVLLAKHSREAFMVKLRVARREFQIMGIVERSSFVPGCEHWESLYTYCRPMYLWEVRKDQLHGVPGSTQQLQQLFEYYYYYFCP